MSDPLKGKSLRDYYLQFCEENKITPNSKFKAMLPTNVGEKLKGTEIDLNRNYVGDRGLIAVAAVLAQCPTIKILRVKNNGLRNKAVINLVEVLKNHKGITTVDLSNNYISTGAGKALEELLEANPRIRELNIDATKIDPEIRLRILDTLEKRNRE